MSTTGLKKYTNLFARLLPQGIAWAKVRCHDLWEGVATEFCRVEERAADLLYREMYPGTATDEQLLKDWETMVGIPDECTPDDQTLNERRDAVLERMARVGSLSNTFYEQIGQILGFDITVEDCYEFRTGISTVGEKLCNVDRLRDVFTVGDHTVGQRLAVFSWQYYFNVILPISENSFFRVGENKVGDPLREFGNELIECSILKLKPAHTGVTFEFVEATP